MRRAAPGLRGTSPPLYAKKFFMLIMVEQILRIKKNILIIKKTKENTFNKKKPRHYDKVDPFCLGTTLSMI